MNIAIIDDMQMEIEILKEMLNEYKKIHTQDFSVSSFTSAKEFLADFKPYSYTLIFLDIFMDDMNGIEAATKIREIDPSATLVFLTTSHEHMLEAFSFHAYDYISKPASPTRIFQLMDDLLPNNEKENSLDFTSNRERVHISYSDIMAVYTADSNYINVIAKDGTSYKVRQTFSSVTEMLEYDNRFLLLIRGILVNMDYIESLQDNSCYLPHDIVLPANVRFFGKVCQKWKNYKLVKERQAQKEHHL